MSEKNANQKQGGNPPEGHVEFAHLDPRTLTIEANVRREVGLDAGFVESIRMHGVKTPIVVQRAGDGSLAVRAGQRRTLAAIEAGIATIPARIVSDDGDKAQLIIDQLVENDARLQLRDADRGAAFEQLSLLGLPAAQIAKKTGHKKADVTTALGVAKSKVATAVQGKYDLDLAQAAVVAEFDGDAEAVKALAVTARENPGQFDHVAQQLRDRRELEAKKVVVVKTLQEAGVRQIPAPKFDDKKVRSLADLTDAAGTVLTPESHKDCPGHAAYVRRSYNDEAFRPVFVCDAWMANKHTPLGSGRPAKPVSPEEAEKARAEKARVREGNAAWRSAQVVRRGWLAGFAKRRTAPKDAAAFYATTVLTEARTLEKASTKGWTLAAEWLGATTKDGFTDRDRLREMIDRTTPARAQHLALVLALAAIEARLDEFTWRNPGSEARYLTALETWGYTLADIEQTARGQSKAAPAKTATKATQPTKATRPTKTKEAVKPTRPATTKPTGTTTPTGKVTPTGNSEATRTGDDAVGDKPVVDAPTKPTTSKTRATDGTTRVAKVAARRLPKARPASPSGTAGNTVRPGAKRSQPKRSPATRKARPATA
ncbi:ParB/RepB/Spo0J family partition protein [Myceligenerans cantabricum]